MRSGWALLPLVVVSAASLDERRAQLRKLGRQYGTDKRIHGFLDLYAERLPPRDQVRSLLEVGVFYGASIQMWRDWYAQADIYGVDAFNGIFGNGNRFSNATKFLHEVRAGLHGPRVHMLVADQASAAEMDGVVGKLGRRRVSFDVILEDGSHKSRDQQLNLAQLMPLVRPGGVYVIEDTHTSLQRGYDVPPKSRQSTLMVMQAFNASRRLDSPFLSPPQTAYLEAWIESVEPVEARGMSEGVHSRTCFVRKRRVAANGHPLS